MAELFPEAVVLAVEPDVFVLAFVAAEIFPDIAVLAVEPSVPFVAVVSLAGVAEPRAAGYILVAFVVLVPASEAVAGAYSSGHPRSVVFPSIDCYARSASSVGGVGGQSVHSTMGARTNYVPYSILAILGPHHNKNSERSYNNPNLDHNTVSDTSDPAMDATTIHSRKTNLCLSQEQRKHQAYQVALSQLGVRRMRWVVVCQY